jgi:hypothetical protein
MSKLVKAIVDYILDGEDKASMVNELRRYKKDFPYESDYNYYKDGNILPYYSQIREFYEKNGVKVSKNDRLMEKEFCLNVGKAIDAILEESE